MARRGLTNNGSDALTASVDGTFSYPTHVAHGAAYAVTVVTQPSGQQCTVTRGSGVATATKSDVAVTCLPIDPGPMPDGGMSGDGDEPTASRGCSGAGTSGSWLLSALCFVITLRRPRR